MISVALCTYNGSKYIEEQLESILNQTVLPDEVIIQDDCSNDNTAFICKNFIERNKLNWKVIINPERKGYRLNFITGLKKTKGDLVFLCDQDDKWLSNKVEVMSDIMKNNKKIKSLTSTVDRIDDEGNIIEKHLKHPYRKKNGLKKITAKEYYLFPQYMGMTMAITRELIDSIDEEYADIITHDMLCNYYAVRMDGLYFIDKVLTERRSIGENISFIESEESLKNRYKGNVQLRLVSENLIILELFNKIDREKRNQSDGQLKKNIATLLVRRDYLNEKKISKAVKNTFRVVKIFGSKVFLKDLLSIL